jgi:hypothetical protein
VLRDLDREARNAAGAALDQNRLARPDLQRVFDRAQRGEPDQRDCRRLDMGQAGRLAGKDRCLDRDLLRIGSLDAHVTYAEHLVTDGEVGHTGAQGTDHAREIASRAVREEGDRTVGARDHPPVCAIHACRMRIDQHLAGPCDRLRIVAEFERFRPAVLAEKDCFHGSSRLCVKEAAVANDTAIGRVAIIGRRSIGAGQRYPRMS